MRVQDPPAPECQANMGEARQRGAVGGRYSAADSQSDGGTVVPRQMQGRKTAINRDRQVALLAALCFGKVDAEDSDEQEQTGGQDERGLTPSAQPLVDQRRRPPLARARLPSVPHVALVAASSRRRSRL